MPSPAKAFNQTNQLLLDIRASASWLLQSTRSATVNTSLPPRKLASSWVV